MREIGYEVTFIAVNPELEETYRPILEELGIENYVVRQFKSGDTFDVGAFSRFIYEKNFNFALIEFWNLAKGWIRLLRSLKKELLIIVDSVKCLFHKGDKRGSTRER